MRKRTDKTDNSSGADKRTNRQITPTTRRNQSGGSAGGGGYDYQAEAYALVAAKILAEEVLNWAETGCDRIPVSVRMETGSGGDDLRISLRSGKKIEVQAKSGLQRGTDLWNALLALAHVVSSDANTYGILLTNGSASNTVKDKLKTGIERIGRNYENLHELPDIVQEFIRRLSAAKLDTCVVCKRLFIRVRDLEPGSQGEETTFNVLRQVIAQPEQAGASRRVLVGDGLDLITLRGSCNSTNLAKILVQDGIVLSPKAKNTLVVREAYLQWSIERNKTFVIPGLQLALPMDKAWVRLKTMSAKSGVASMTTLEEQIRSYHEWHRLAEINARSDSISIEMAARVNRLLVVVAGPGAGKSTHWHTLGQAKTNCCCTFHCGAFICV